MKSRTMKMMMKTWRELRMRMRRDSDDEEVKRIMMKRGMKMTMEKWRTRGE